MRQLTPASVTKNRIKSDYHHALEGFADWYFNVFPTRDSVADSDERTTLLVPNAVALRYFDIADKSKFVQVKWCISTNRCTTSTLKCICTQWRQR